MYFTFVMFAFNSGTLFDGIWYNNNNRKVQGMLWRIIFIIRTLHIIMSFTFYL